MIFTFSYFAVAFAIATAICSALSLYTWRRRRTPGSFYFAVFLASAAVWALASALENSVADAPSKILFSKLSYLGLATVAPLWLLFAVDYGQRTRWLHSRWLRLIWVIPVAVILLALTNDWHGLVWPGITPVSDAPGAILVYAHGPAVWINVMSAYALMLGGSIILLETALRSFRQSYLPAVTMILGIVVSLAANILYVTGLNPIRGLDITPFAFTVSGLLFTWAIFGQRLFELVPVAREMLIQVMADGAIVLDDEEKVVEINPAARRILNVPEGEGARDIGLAAGRWPALARGFQSELDVIEEVRIDSPGGATWLDVRVSVLRDASGRLAGRLVVLQDVTRRKLAEEDLKRFNEALKSEVAEKARAQEALTTSLHEKEVLLKEIHHRVKNNLQVISSLLSLQTANRDNDPTAALRESQDRIRSMALIHEKLYRSDDVASIDFREYVEGLTAGLFRSYFPGPGVRIIVEVEDVSLDIDLAIPCGLIVNELVSNSLKYAFRDGRSGEVRIGLVREDRKYTLTVSDDGPGLPPGVDFRDTPSLGLQLVNMLVGQLEGNIEMDCSRGTRFKITFSEIENRLWSR
jgi:two-component sensor histidine kinase/PAS domain-containing protein